MNCDDMRTISLTRGKSAIIDAADYGLVCQFKWHSQAGRGDNFYARFSVTIAGHRGCVLMHRFILGIVDPGIYIDHIDGNGLNNRRSNLRSCTHSQNQANTNKRSVKCTSRYRGVHWSKAANKWVSEIGSNGKKKHLGCFDNEDDAARAYDTALFEKHGEFARANFPLQERA